MYAGFNFTGHCFLHRFKPQGRKSINLLFVDASNSYAQVDVENKIMSALGEASFPVLKMYLFYEDKTIMGQEFYLMEYIKVKRLF